MCVQISTALQISQGIHPPVAQNGAILDHDTTEFQTRQGILGRCSNRGFLWSLHQAAISHLALGLDLGLDHLLSRPLQPQLALERMHGIVAHVSSEGCRLHQLLCPGLVDLAILHNHPGDRQKVSLGVSKELRVSALRLPMQMLYVHLCIVELRHIVGIRQLNGLACPLNVFKHVEEALKKAVGGAEPTPKPRDGSVLEEALHACVLDVALHLGIGCHVIVIQGQGAMVAIQMNHRTTLGRAQRETLPAGDGDLQGVAQVVLESQRFQFFEGSVWKCRGQAARRL
mmetsp:Transcript_104545/g.248828  ORF Transcript_104545/g.248828 Transcript_104545/m.248828 type:complete len:285 (-) Transcript_104545:808-1662(-)